MDRIGVFFGGKSSEHEISLMSAEAVLNNIDRDRHQVVCIGISREGIWKLFEGSPGKLPDGSWEDDAREISVNEACDMIDFALPMLHGNVGEDGRLQGLFETMEVPYAGSNVAGSAVCMDKVFSKEIFLQHGLDSPDYAVLRMVDYRKDPDGIAEVYQMLIPYPAFVKPANTGSSVGISKVRSLEELKAAIELAAQYDERIIIEENIDGREVECAVLGNEEPIASGVGEIIFTRDFYDYEAKYSDDGGTKIVIPAELSEGVVEEVRNMARQAYIATACSGFARVDFIVENETNRVYINEINTIPGMTKYSMFPTLWKEQGMSFTEMIERIIEHGYERYNAKDHR